MDSNTKVPSFSRNGESIPGIASMRDAHTSWYEANNVENNEDDDDDACGTDKVVCACRVPMVGDELVDPQQPVVVLVL